MSLPSIAPSGSRERPRNTSSSWETLLEVVLVSILGRDLRLGLLNQSESKGACFLSPPGSLELSLWL